MTLAHYRFRNDNLPEEVVVVTIIEGKKKVKYEVHREVNVIEHDEASARHKAKRERYEDLLARQADSTLVIEAIDLQADYKLVQVFELGPNWA